MLMAEICLSFVVLLYHKLPPGGRRLACGPEPGPQDSQVTSNNQHTKIAIYTKGYNFFAMVVFIEKDLLLSFATLYHEEYGLIETRRLTCSTDRIPSVEPNQRSRLRICLHDGPPVSRTRHGPDGRAEATATSGCSAGSGPGQSTMADIVGRPSGGPVLVAGGRPEMATCGESR
jgi:hypothetical protein